MQTRTLGLLNDLAANNASVTELHSAAIALALTKYIDIDLGNNEDAVRKSISGILDSISRYAPLSLGAVYQGVNQIHQYRLTVSNGYFANSTGGTSIDWLFGLNFYLSKNLVEQLTSPGFIQVYRKYLSVITDIVEG